MSPAANMLLGGKRSEDVAIAPSSVRGVTFQAAAAGGAAPAALEPQAAGKRREHAGVDEARDYLVPASARHLAKNMFDFSTASGPMVSLIHSSLGSARHFAQQALSTGSSGTYL
jgi:hypothetical protein